MTKQQQVEEIIAVLTAAADPSVAEQSKRFFKTGPESYGHADLFLGLRVPFLRTTAKRYHSIGLAQIRSLLQSRYHEIRLCGVFMLVFRFQQGCDIDKDQVYQFYIEHTQYINSWDLVDSSAYQIVGPYTEHGSKAVLTRLAKSKDIWERRIAIIATLHFIRNGHYKTTLRIAKILLKDKEDIIQKAVGWMLREVGNRDPSSENSFLELHASSMPRTMLRYAIEKYPEDERQAWLVRSRDTAAKHQ